MIKLFQNITIFIENSFPFFIHHHIFDKDIANAFGGDINILGIRKKPKTPIKRKSARLQKKHQ